MCIIKGNDEDGCQNYIRVLAMKKPDTLLTCGTNAFKPICRNYFVKNDGYFLDGEVLGQAMCPYNPAHNSTAIFVDGNLYSGTVADFSGMDPIIYREPLQTEQYDSVSLNDPNFVGSMAQGEHVYFFFRETAVEYINCGKSVFSRVGRVCKQDKGGPHRFRHRWTSFLKSRLNCSVPGDFPFYFNEIQSTTDIVEGEYGGTAAHLVYGTFTTPPNSISGSAVCAFSLQDISDTFEGNFKEQTGINTNWLAVNSAKVPEPRPGSCREDSSNLPDQTLNFIRAHPLMDESVPSFFGEPIVVISALSSPFSYRFTQISVDPQVKTPGGKTYDVLFIGTDNGKVIKAINANSADSVHGVNPVVIEELQVFGLKEPVRSLSVVRGTGPGSSGDRLIAVSDSEVQSLKLHRCNSDKIKSCSECVALQDPYCSWDKIAGRCKAVEPQLLDENNFYQSVSTGQHAACPQSKILGKDAGSVGGLSSTQSKYNDLQRPSKEQTRGEVINIMQDKEFTNTPAEGPAVSAADSLPSAYSAETLALAVAAGALAALAVGFVAGYVCGRKCHKDEDDNLPYPDTEYEYFEQRQNINRIQAEPKLLSQVEEVTYAEPVLVPPGGQLKAPHSPRSTLRKAPHPPYPHPAHPAHPSHLGHSDHPHAETLFQFQQPDGPAGYRQDRDNFGTLRSHQGDGYRRGNDGFSTTRSVKKVYL
ncbi:semaphorin 1a isoform X2 [Arctopsyche grandis]